MASAKTTIKEHHTTAKSLTASLIKHSQKSGGAWAWQRIGFDTEITLYQFASPSCVPDYLRDEMAHTNHKMAFRGRMVPFTDAAIRRESRREMAGCGDR